MPRFARIVAPGLAHHVTQRGNNRQDVFFTVDDRRLYLEILLEESRRWNVVVEAWCLMTNHVHLIVTPPDAPSLHRAIGRTHWRYAQAINRLHRRSGHLWQGRFFSCPLEGEHVISAIRYVERNPVRAKLVRLARRFDWSSAQAHCGGRDMTGLLDLPAWRKQFRGAEWERILGQIDDPEAIRCLRGATRSGRPLASDSFLAKLEARLGRRLRPLPVGRPRKGKASDDAKSTRRKRTPSRRSTRGRKRGTRT